MSYQEITVVLHGAEAALAVAKAHTRGLRPWLPHRAKVFAGPDREGNYSWLIYWWDDYFPGHPEGEHVWRERGQVCCGIPPFKVSSRGAPVGVRPG